MEAPTRKELEDLMEENETLAEENAELRRRLRVLEAKSDELEGNKRLHFYRQYALKRASKMSSRDVSNLSLDIIASRRRVNELQRLRHTLNHDSF